MMRLATPIVFAFCLLVVISCTLLYNTDCESRRYVRRFENDNLTYENGFLEEVQVGMRAECFPLCDRMEHCNMVLYNYMTYRCRLNQYFHFNTTEVGTEQSGWQFYGVTCSSTTNSSDCPLSSLSANCSSCLDGDTWSTDRNCVLFHKSHSHMGGVEKDILLPFTLSAGMSVILEGAVNNPAFWPDFYLDDHPAYEYFVGIEVSPSQDKITTMNEANETVYHGTFPIITFLKFTLMMAIKETNIEIFADGTLIKVYPRPPANLNVVYYRHFDRVFHGMVVLKPTYCN